MSIRIFEHIFGHKLLVIIPVLVALIAGGLWEYKSYETHYESWATIWAEKPADFTGASASLSDFNPYISSAANYSGALQELLGTNSFVEGVLARVDGPAASYPLQRYKDIRTKTLIWPSGNHTVYIRSASSDPHMAAKIPQAIVDEFTVVFSKQLKASAAQAATFYQDQVTSGKSDYDNATLALSAYVRTHPTLANIQIGNQSIATISDPDFGPLLLQQRTAETQYDSMLAKLSASQIAATSADSTTSYYYVVDPPKVADYKTLPGKKALLVKPVSAAVVGVMVAGALLLLTWRMDRKARFPTDFSFLGNNLTVITLPVVKARRRGHWPASFVRLGAALTAGANRLSIDPSAADVRSPANPARP